MGPGRGEGNRHFASALSAKKSRTDYPFTRYTRAGSLVVHLRCRRSLGNRVGSRVSRLVGPVGVRRAARRPDRATGMPVAANKAYMRAHEDGGEWQSRFCRKKRKQRASAAVPLRAKCIRLVGEL